MNTQLKSHIVKEAVVASLAPPILPVVIEQTARNVFESFSEKMKSTLNGRQERALKMALEGHVTHKSERIFSVRSEDGKHSYLVNLGKGFCTCPDSHHGNVCKHRLAAYLIEQASQAANEVSQEQLPPATHSDEPSLPPPMNTEEDAIEKARLVLQARSQFLREAIIYAMVQVDGESIPVELISLEGEVALVRALPKLLDNKLVPQFPFPERKSFTQVLARSLEEVKIYR